MQTTLLGLGIAIILALLAALVGPYFVNWNDHRAFFEREATRLTGLNVRVNGEIKVGILPVPKVNFDGIEVRPAGDANRLRARSLSVELGLGPLMRGEIRATEMRLVGPEFGIGLNAAGEVDWPAVTLPNESLAIDRLSIEDGRIMLTDAASGSRLSLDKLWFVGDMRSLAGPFRGDGAFAVDGSLFNYRFNAGRYGPDGTRVRLGIDTAERQLSAEAEGQLAFENGRPKFDGALTLSQLVGSVPGDGKTAPGEPWRLTGKVSADPRLALFEQVAFQYGPEERAARLGGTAELKFGDRPRLQAALSARQLDLDRMLAPPETPHRRAFAAIHALGEMIGVAARPPLPVSLAVSVDAAVLGGQTVQGFGGDVRFTGTEWQLQKLEFRAPGFTRVSFSGRIDPTGSGFSGAASIDANDPRTLLNWLIGEAAGASQIKPWQIRGDISLAADRIAIERLKAEFDRGSVEGRLAYLWPAAGRAARLDATLTASELDLDAVLAFGDSTFAGLGMPWPREIALALDVERGRIAGFDARNTVARVSFDGRGVSVDRLSIADFGSASVQARGRIEIAPAPGGSISIDLDARQIDGMIALADKFAPTVAEPLRRLAAQQKSAKLAINVGLTNTGSGVAAGRLGLTGRVGAIRINLAADATGKPDDFANGDLQSLATAELRLDAQLRADDSTMLLSLAGLERFALADKRAGLFSISATGTPGEDVRFDGKLVAGGIDAVANGTLRLPQGKPAAVELDQVSGTFYGNRVHGRLAVRLGEGPQIDGAIETETLDAPAIIAAAIGMKRQTGRANAPGWSPEPFVLNASGVSGRIAFTAARAAFSSELVARQMRGVAQLGPSRVAFENIEGELANGRFGGQLEFGTSAEGLTARANLQLEAADMESVFAGAGRPPITGRVTFKAAVQGAGLSPAAFVGSLTGNGSISLDSARFASLNPRMFDAVIRAVDLGIPADANRIRAFVGSALDGGTLSLLEARADLSIAAGQARLTNVVTQADGVDIRLTGALDLASTSLDASVTLTGRHTIGGADHPSVLISLKGALPAPQRSVDANMLASWLALRAVDQQAKQLEAMERAQREQLEREQAQREQLERARREAIAPASAPSVPTDVSRPEMQAPAQSDTDPATSPLKDRSNDATRGINPAEQAPPLPPAIDIGSAPRAPHADAAVPTGQPRTQPRQRQPRQARPPTPPLDLLGNAYR